jgi:hypothetical protein
MRFLKPINPLFAAVLTIAALAATRPLAQTGDVTDAPRRLVFSGMIDADFASDYGALDQARHTTGLEADLTTQVLINPTLYAVVRTTLRDGTVPRQGAGNTRAPLAYDGAQINWKADDQTVVMVGDLIGGAGYFQYYRYKRAAAVVGEHSVRGAGVRHGNLLVQAGMATDSTGINGDWSVFARWRRTIRENAAWTPSLRYTVGVPGAMPFELGLSFDGLFEDVLELHAHTGMQYWNPDTDPGTFALIEPRYSYEPYFVSGTIFISDKGEVPSPNAPRRTASWTPLDDFLLQVEPGLALNKTFSASVSLEYRNATFSSNRDEAFWFIPTLYVYPAPRAQWWLWTGLTKPLVQGTGSAPRLSLGSEIVFTF